VPSELEAARLSLVRISPTDQPDARHALERAIAISARTLEVERVSVWVFEDADTLRSLATLDTTVGIPGVGSRAGGMLETSSSPRYFAALRSRRALAAEDVETDTRVQELLPYFRAYGIRSLLDIPVFLGGDMVGIVCHEHVGMARVWSKRDIDFAVSVADVVSALLGSYRRIFLEEELAKERAALAAVSRMDAQASLARHVAHDVNNLLTIIAAATRKISPVESAKFIEEQCLRGGALMRQLLEFSGGPPRRVVDAVVDLRAAVAGAEALMRAAAGGSCLLEIEPLPLVPVRIKGSESDIDQILLNLVLNARDASPPQGRIRVALELPPTVEEAHLCVSDEGSGISPEHLERIFDPYFTTKRDRGGAGLGLAITHGLVKRLGGVIDVRSAPGETFFRVRFPLEGPITARTV
jgi:signal transduction histidine kinase